MTEEKAASEIPLDDMLKDPAKVIKQEYRKSKDKVAQTTELDEKTYLLGFMPQVEAISLILDELGENFDFERLKKLWLPKSAIATSLSQTDPYIVDDSNINTIVQEIDKKYESKLQEIENKLQTYPFWKANPHSIKLINIDYLIALQNNVNLNRVRNMIQKISENSTITELLDFAIDFKRDNVHIDYNVSGQNYALFTTDDHDIRLAPPQIRMLPKYIKDNKPLTREVVPSLVIQVTPGDPFVYCVRTWGLRQNPDGSLTKVYYLTLQNGIHRAYALKSIGIPSIPCIVIDSISLQDTDMLMSNWMPERRQQGVSIRPPTIKDFFNTDLTETFKVRKKKLFLKVNWNIEKFFA